MSRPEQSTQNDNVELVPESTAPLSTINKLVEDNSMYNVRIDQKEGRLMTCQGPNRILRSHCTRLGVRRKWYKDGVEQEHGNEEQRCVDEGRAK